jgi:hypothetical protein
MPAPLRQHSSGHNDPPVTSHGTLPPTLPHSSSEDKPCQSAAELRSFIPEVDEPVLELTAEAAICKIADVLQLEEGRHEPGAVAAAVKGLVKGHAQLRRMLDAEQKKQLSYHVQVLASPCG